ncbi:hypothetical protein V8C35DRAFT_331595 [Trichoderma chlorosporum]
MIARFSRFGIWKALAVAIALAPSAWSCPPPGSRFSFPDGFLRNDTRQLSKRYTGIIPGNGDDGYNVEYNNDVPFISNNNGNQWPAGLISVCVDPSVDSDTASDYQLGLLDALNLWYVSGLSSSAFTMEFLSTDECEKLGVTGPKKDFLWVQSADDEDDSIEMSSSLGNKNTGSTMDCRSTSWFQTNHPEAPDPDIEKARTYAHELGHIFGLLHEMQNPNAWTEVHGGIASENLFQFNCENLADYDECLDDMREYYQDADDAMDFACTSAFGSFQCPCTTTEDGQHLSSHEWLPEIGAAQYYRYSAQVDLLSIMMYKSTSGNKAPGLAVYQLANPISGSGLLGPTDGYSSFTPSAIDIGGAILMSPNPGASVTYAPYWTVASPMHATWSATNAPFGDCQIPSASPQKRHEDLKQRASAARIALKRSIGIISSS